MFDHSSGYVSLNTYAEQKHLIRRTTATAAMENTVSPRNLLRPNTQTTFIAEEVLHALNSFKTPDQ